LPAIVEADDDGLYVLKFRGAGQGAKALIAELVAGEIARAAGLVGARDRFHPTRCRTRAHRADAEIQDLIRASVGLNLALDYLPGSVAFDPLAQPVAADLASTIVWFDAFVSNPDRTARNTNLLVWHRRTWLIDHGAALYFHHNWADAAQTSMSAICNASGHHVWASPMASRLQEIDAQMIERNHSRTHRRDRANSYPTAGSAPSPCSPTQAKIAPLHPCSFRAGCSRRALLSRRPSVPGLCTYDYAIVRVGPRAWSAASSSMPA